MIAISEGVILLKPRQPDPEVRAEAEAFSAEVDEYRAYVTRPRPRRITPPPNTPNYSPKTRRAWKPRRVLILLFWLGAILWVAHLI